MELAGYETEQHFPEIVYCVEAIGYVLNEPNHRRVYYMLEQGQVPGARKMGRIWALSPPVFRREMHGEAALPMESTYRDRPSRRAVRLALSWQVPRGDNPPERHSPAVGDGQAMSCDGDGHRRRARRA